LAKGTPVSEAEEAEICEALKSGKSQNQTAKDFDRAPDTIHRIADRNGLVYTSPKKAHEARTRYASEERIGLLANCLDKGRDLLAECETPRGYKDLMIGIGIGLDKRHQEEGGGGSSLGEIKLLFSKMEAES